jgi:hypothetical protein
MTRHEFSRRLADSVVTQVGVLVVVAVGKTLMRSPVLVVAGIAGGVVGAVAVSLLTNEGPATTDPQKPTSAPILIRR